MEVAAHDGSYCFWVLQFVQQQVPCKWGVHAHLGGRGLFQNVVAEALFARRCYDRRPCGVAGFILATNDSFGQRMIATYIH